VPLDYRDISIFITNKNRLDVGFRDQIIWWLDTSMKDITVLDNGSTYPPLLKFYDEIKNEVKIIFVPNLGERAPWAFWDLGYRDQFEDRHVIINDSDCCPDKDCPKDLISQMLAVLDAYPECKKVSTGLRIDNLPEHFKFRDKVIDEEGWNWKDRVIPEILGLPRLFNAHTDTSLTLYRNSQTVLWTDQQFRTDFPYVCQHYPWYSDSRPLMKTHEEMFYLKNLADGWANWQSEKRDASI
jgi:hypothetical protein